VLANDVLNLSRRFSPGEAPLWTADKREDGSLKLSEVAPNTWELQVENPAIGTCFSLDWKLPARTGNSRDDRIEQEVQGVQGQLFAHRWRRMEGEPGGPIYEVFRDFDHRVRSLFGQDGGLPNLHLLAYNHRLRRMETVDGICAGGEPVPNAWNFWLPFGLGMGGACFKNPRAYLYVPPDPASPRKPDYFLYVEGSERPPAALLTLPLFHPEYEPPVVSDYDASVPLERGRQCIGVVDIVSPESGDRLVEIATSEELFSSIVDLSRDFAEQLFITCRKAMVPTP
jgi:hypothetical protein